ncbi:hypothetical protein GCM10028827_11690 [Mucilaginibacter myungsuensis]
MNLRAPSNIKIDGKPAEWGAMQAYNNATEVSYTIANDDKNLYLTIQAKERRIINKIMNGGVQLAINPTGKKITPDMVRITYPTFEKGQRPTLNLSAQVTDGLSPDAQRKLADSLTNINNGKMVKSAKYIKVHGVSGMDTLVSIYNDEGVKAAALIDDKMVYTYEMAVALKHLGMDANKGTKFFYNVKLNPMEFADIPGINVAKAADGTILSININSNIAKPYSAATVATDFWGEYQLKGKSN